MNTKSTIVSEKSISAAFNEINELNETEYMKLLQRFLKEQPVITSFLKISQEEMGEDDFEELINFALIIWCAFVKEIKNVPELTTDIIESFEENEEGNINQVIDAFNARDEFEAKSKMEDFMKDMQGINDEKGFAELSKKYGNDLEGILSSLSFLDTSQPHLHEFLLSMTLPSEDIFSLEMEDMEIYNNLMQMVKWFNHAINHAPQLEITPGGRIESSNDKNPQIFQVKINLKHIKPPVWRRVLIPGNMSLLDLHTVIQHVMGWQDYHLWQFIINRNYYTDKTKGEGMLDDFFMESFDAGKTLLQDVVTKEKQKFGYEYDFGDGWEHSIVVEKILPFDKNSFYPLCLKGKRACPPEDCGGIPGYYELIEIIGDKDHPEHEEMSEWLGYEFDPEFFDINEANQALREVFEKF